MERYLIIFKGIVQGVGFRYTCQMIAIKHHLTGNVRNLDNGNVELFIQGNKDDFTNFLKDILNTDNRWIRIEDYSIKKIDIIENEKNFSILY